MLNSIEQQMFQHEKESYIADHVVKRLLYENCTQQEYRNILNEYSCAMGSSAIIRFNPFSIIRYIV
jgi:hypothetical protein